MLTVNAPAGSQDMVDCAAKSVTGNVFAMNYFTRASRQDPKPTDRKVFVMEAPAQESSRVSTHSYNLYGSRGGGRGLWRAAGAYRRHGPC